MATDKTVRIVELQAKVTGLEELQKAAASMNAASGAARKAGADFSKAGASVQKGFSGNTTNQIKNASFQLTDFAVQVQGGTDAMRAFGQQAPQLLAGFGAAGAVAGLVVSLMPAVIASFGGAAVKIEDASKAAEIFRGAVADVKAIVDKTDMDDFAEAFNKLDAQARKAAIALIETRLQLGKLAGAKEKQELDDYMRSFGTFSIGFGKFGRDLDSATSGQTIAQKLGITREAGDAVKDVLQGLSKGTLDQVSALEKLNKLNITGNKDFNEFLGNMAKATKNTLELTAAESELVRIRDAAVKVGGKSIVLSKDLADASKKQADEAKRVAEQLIKIKEAAADREIDAITKQFDDMAKATKAAADQAIKLREAAMDKEIDAISASFSKLGGESPLTKIVDELNALGQRTRDLEALREKLDDLYFSGKITGEEFEAMGQKFGLVFNPDSAAVQGIDSMKQSMQNLAVQGVGGLVDTIFDASKSFKDFAADFLKQIAKMIIQQQLLNALKGSSFGKALGFAKGGAFASSTGLPWGIYDKPTYFNMPGSGPLKKFARGGVLGEAGAEAILPLSRNSQGVLGLKGGGTKVSVNVNNYSTNEVSVSETKGADGQISIDVEIKKSMTRAFGDGSMDRVMKSAFGLSRQAA